MDANLVISYSVFRAFLDLADLAVFLLYTLARLLPDSRASISSEAILERSAYMLLPHIDISCKSWLFEFLETLFLIAYVY